jgi:hypothetical protein
MSIRTGWCAVDSELSTDDMIERLLKRFPLWYDSEEEALRNCNNPSGNVVFVPRRVTLSVIIDDRQAVPGTPPPPEAGEPISPPPSQTTAFDLRKLVAEVEARKDRRDQHMLEVLPNLIVDHMLKECAAKAGVGARSKRFDVFLAIRSIMSVIPLGREFANDGEMTESCLRIRFHLGERVRSLLTDLGFSCTTTIKDSSFMIEISW